MVRHAARSIRLADSWPAPVVVVVVLVAVSGCTALASGATAWRPHGQARPAAPTAAVVENSDPIVAADLALVVHKRRRTLEVYRFGNLTREYTITIGSTPNGRKRYEGDMRTPEGLYRITDKREHRRWRYFLEIDYPNEEDIRRYERDVSQHLIPRIDGHVLGIGGALGIHGNDRANAQAAGRDWTHGCVAMANDDIVQLFELVTIGTPVLFVP